MSFVSRGTRTAARPLRQFPRRQPRRNASHGAGHGHDSGHQESALHVAGGAGNEALGKGFYLALGLVPVSIGSYFYATSEDNAISRLVEEYKTKDDSEARRNLVHTTMMEEALQDRRLFKSGATDTSGPDLRYPEQLNHGSPWNVAAGEGTADLAALMTHYEEQRRKLDEDKLAKMKNGEIVSVYENYDDKAEVRRQQYRALG